MMAQGHAFDLVIRGGTVYDPVNDRDGVVRDLWIRDGKIVASPDDPAIGATRTLDARGLVIMPGGIDMHCHIAGSKVNLARKLQPEAARDAPPLARGPTTRSGTQGHVPSTFATGYRYAAMGYTAAFEAAIQPIAARHAHEELSDPPCIDKGFYILVGNSHYLLKAVGHRDNSRARDFLAWLLNASKAYALKVVNPGGIETWKQRQAGNLASLDERVGHFGVTPRQIIEAVARAADELRLPHGIHLHCNQLGVPGNWQTTLESMRALEGHRGHLTHIQFHSYGGDDESTLHSRTPELVAYVGSHRNVTVDVGQVLFGATTSMTGDGPLGYLLHRIYGGKWYSADIECESGCGIVPIEYKRKSLIHAWQWAIGLEWYLLMSDPWRIAMSTDHPNGGSFLAYPQIIRLLMDRAYRREVFSMIHPEVRRRSCLGELDREYSLREVCIITRAAPARILGLTQKGHLGPGADADVTAYAPASDWARMFQLPRWVIKAGQVVLEDGEVRAPPAGAALHVCPAYDKRIESQLAGWFRRHYSIEFASYAIGGQELSHPREIECG
jgi:formylmethanofuran dehydrogenase subunit A